MSVHLPRQRRCDSAGVEGVKVDRFDTGGELLRPYRAPDGTLLVEGRVAKPGVLLYVDAFGNVTRELITEEELHKADSLGSLGRVALTLEHPEENVTPDNVQDLGVGDVDGEVRTEAEGFVRVKLAIRRRDAQSAVDDGKVELSPGYECVVVQIPGTHPVYGEYDAIQKDRIYNHVALTDRARGGSSIRLRTDGAAMQLPEEKGEPGMNRRILALLAYLGLNPSRYDSDDAALEAIEREIEARKTKHDSVEATLAELQGRFDALGVEHNTLKTKHDTLKAEHATMKAEHTTLKADSEAREAASQRAALLEIGARVEGFDTSTVAEDIAVSDLRRQIASKHCDNKGIELPEGASEDYVTGILALVPKRADSEVIDPWKSVVDLDKGGTSDRVDSQDKTSDQTYYERCDAAFKASKGA